MRRNLLIVLGLGTLVACLAAANLGREPGRFDLDWRLVRQPPREVSAEIPARGPIVQTITAPGVIEAIDEAEIASQIVGRVVAVEVEEGDAVRRGDLLVKLDETEAKARLDSAEARIDRLRSAIAQCEAELEKAERDVNQHGQLAGRGFSSPTQLLDAKSNVAKCQAGLEMSRHELVESQAMRLTSRQDLDRTEIRSPIDGVVANLEVERGEVVIAGTTNLPGTVLMTVSDPNRLRARADVDESDVPLVRAGQLARVYLQADQRDPIEGTVDRVAAKGKEAGEVVIFETLVGIDSKHQALRMGMTATIEVEVDRSADARGVPVQAVVHRRLKDLPRTPALRSWAEQHARSPGEKASEAEARYVKIVFVADGAVARARPVETGLSDERHVEIVEGLADIDRVIVGPFRALDELKDGDAIALAAPESATATRP